jgi:xylulokinase
MTDLPAGLRVVAGAGDGQSAGLGANVTRTGQAYLNLGTAVVSGAHAEQYIHDLAFRALASPIAGTYTLETLIRGGTFTIGWFADHFAHDLQAASARSVEDQLEEAARAVPPGALGLLAVPYWNGVATPYWDGSASGITVGWTGSHGREHFYRALPEGIAFEQRLSTEGIERATGQPIEEYIVLGGGSRSALWCQIVADISGRRVTRANTPEATCLGAGVLAAVAAGWYDDARSAADAMTSSGESFEPHPATQQIYDRLYREIYLGLYPALRASLRRLTELSRGAA